MKQELDALGQPIRVGSFVTWLWNMKVPGGSRPYLAFGIVSKLNPSTLVMKTICSPKQPSIISQLIRSQYDSVVVINDHYLRDSMIDAMHMDQELRDLIKELH